MFGFGRKNLDNRPSPLVITRKWTDKSGVSHKETEVKPSVKKLEAGAVVGGAAGVAAAKAIGMAVGVSLGPLGMVIGGAIGATICGTIGYIWGKD